MQKAYNRTIWKNYPREESPLNEENLNKLSAALDEVDNRVLEHETTKLDKTTAYGMVKDIDFDEDSGIFTVTKLNGAKLVIDTKLEKIATNWDYDEDSQRLVIILDDGTKKYVDVSALVTQYEFEESDTIYFELLSNGKIKAHIKNGSITGEMLEPNYLANVTIQAETASQKASEASDSAQAASRSATNAKVSENNSKDSATEAEVSATNASGSEAKANDYAAEAADNMESAKNYAATASRKATEAANSATNSAESATKASRSATAASVSETNAANSAGIAQNASREAQNRCSDVEYLAYQVSQNATDANNAMVTVQEIRDQVAEQSATVENYAKEVEDKHLDIFTRGSLVLEIEEHVKAYEANTIQKAAEAANSAEIATQKADSISESAALAESYAVGGTGTRENEDVDNAKYYKEQAERISQGLAGSLLPMGTVTFAQLSKQSKQPGYMYNISDSFVTDSTFKEGAGNTYAAGTNVYYTADGFWDCIAGTNVVGVKGAKETSYRQGNVNLTPENIGALSENGNAKDVTVTFTEATSLTELESGEKMPISFGKIKLAIKNTIALVKLLGSTDISAIGDGTVTGGLSTLNRKVSNCYSLTDGVELGEGDDLNDVITPGMYHANNTIANSITNCPCANLGFRLRVEKSSSVSDCVRHTLITYNGQKYERNYNAINSTWSKWDSDRYYDGDKITFSNFQALFVGVWYTKNSLRFFIPFPKKICSVNIGVNIGFDEIEVFGVNSSIRLDASVAETAQIQKNADLGGVLVIITPTTSVNVTEHTPATVRVKNCEISFQW